LDEQIEDLFKSKRSTKEANEAEAAQTAIAAAQATAATAIAQAAQGLAENTVADKLKLAKGIADRVSANRGQSAAKDTNVEQVARSFLGGSVMNASLTVCFFFS
jgi:predicted NodU family carbamoyl transferase